MPESRMAVSLICVLGGPHSRSHGYEYLIGAALVLRHILQANMMSHAHQQRAMSLCYDHQVAACNLHGMMHTEKGLLATEYLKPSAVPPSQAALFKSAMTKQRATPPNCQLCLTSL